MSAGCLVIGSDTAPVQEVLNDSNGIKVPFFDTTRLADTVIEALTARDRFKPVRVAARRTVLDRYDLTKSCLPALVDFVRTPREAPGAGQG
jgi:glycosyltransferase involved in cell wall biosynthesis